MRAWLGRLVVGYVLLMAGWPAVHLLFWAEGLGTDEVEPLFAFFGQRLAYTALQASLSALLCAAVGVPVAWVLARYTFWSRSFWVRGLMLPFVIPTLVAAMGVLALFGPQGLWPSWGATLGPLAMLVYGNVFFNTGLIVKACMDGLQRVDLRLLEVARTLGASPWRVFWQVEWPLMRPWLWSALLLVFLYCFSDFGLVLVLGGSRFASLEVVIYQLIAHELDLVQARYWALASVLLHAGLALLYLYVQSRQASRTDVKPRPLSIVKGLPAQLSVLAVCSTLVLLTWAPIVAVAWGAWLAVDLQTLQTLAQDTPFFLAVANTLLFGLAGVVLATCLGMLQGWSTQNTRIWAYAPFMVSPVLVGFGLLSAYPSMAGHGAVLVSAYAFLAFPFVAQAIHAWRDSVPGTWAQAAATLGASPWRVWWRIEWPLSRPYLRRGVAIAAATCMGEFAVSLFLSRPEWITLSTYVYEQLGRPGAQHHAQALIASTVLLCLAMCCFVLIDVGTEPRRPHAQN